MVKRLLMEQDLLIRLSDNGKLPSGIHAVSWDAFVATFGYNSLRKFLIQHLHDAIKLLRHAGCKYIYIDGSFVTNKDYPNDIDVIWEGYNVEISKLDFRFANPILGKRDFLCDFLLLDDDDPYMLELFQQDRQGNPKGLLKIEISSDLQFDL